MDAFTFQKRSGTSYVRKKPIPTDTKTVAQLAQRQKYRDAVTAWHALTAEEKEAWLGQCPGLTAYQCFISSELKPAPPPPPPEEYTEEQVTGTAIFEMFIGWNVRLGQKLTISNRKVTKLGFWLKRSGSPTGNVTFTIRRVTDDYVILSKVWGDAGDLPGSVSYEELEFATPETINEQVRISAEYSGGNSSNTVDVQHSSINVKGNEMLSWCRDTTWSDRSDRDMRYRYKYYLP